MNNDARPALEGLCKKVSTANLERVRRIKSRLTRIVSRVSKAGAYTRPLFCSR